jgi:Dyp-type peroxidase family
MDNIAWHDVQGLLLSGYPQLPWSVYLPFRWRDGAAEGARAWLGALAPRLMRAGAAGEPAAPGGAAAPHLQLLKAKAPPVALNLALTAPGIAAVSGAAALAPFSLEFREGMAPARGNGPVPRRCNVLGDLGASSPASWDWGGWNGNPSVDGLLMLFAADEATLEALVARELEALRRVAEPLVAPDNGGPLRLTSRLYDDLKEHFGFRDGISQPIIEGSPRAERLAENREAYRIHVVKPGEFVFGYPNERRVTSGRDDLRNNGSYLVLRQLEQDVAEFNRFVEQAARQMPDPSPLAVKCEWIRARLVGRDSDGVPLARASDGTVGGDGELARAKINDFLFAHEDPAGLRCPIGSHIRRANPRDGRGDDPEAALLLSRMHRLIRRGRMYGERFDPARPDDGGRRGTLFMALNADIAGQFEMIQHSWLNNRHFGDRHVGTDPLGHLDETEEAIVIQDRPVNLVLDKRKPFVRVRGGAYFFLPGIEAVRRMAQPV